MDPKLLDWRGVEITPDCTIVYANYGSSSLFLTEATVLSMRFFPDQPSYRAWRLIVRTIRDNNRLHHEHIPRVTSLIAMDKITVVQPQEG
jgi:hypothetical protein